MSLACGLQMYSVRTEMAADPIVTTRAVLDLGYQHLEFANLSVDDPGVGFPVDPAELRRVIEDGGGNPLSTHLATIDPLRLSPVLEFHQELGTTYLASKLLFRDRADLQDLARNLNRAGAMMAEAGIQHIVHTSLLRSAGSRTDLDDLLDLLDPELRNVELDTYWIHRSGLSIPEIIERYGEWIRILHQKDLPASIRQPVNIVGALPLDAPLTAEVYYNDPAYCAPDNFTEVGSGVLPLQPVIDAALANSAAEYILVEQDFTTLPELESVRVSLACLGQLKGVTV